MELPKVGKIDFGNFTTAKKVTAGILTLPVVALFVALAVSYSVSAGTKIVEGVSYEGRELGGLLPGTTKEILQKDADKKIHSITFTFENGEFEVTPADINWTPEIDEAARVAENYGRGKGLIKNFIEQTDCRMNGREVKLLATFDEDLLKNKLDEIAAKINRQPANAFCILHPNGLIERYPGIVGKKLDTEKVVGSLKDKLENLNLSAEKIALEPENIEPFIKTEDLQNIDSVIGSFSTAYYPGDRGDNIWIAANALCHKIIKPGWEFSFNTTVGHRDAAAGYKKAGVIIDGEFTDDYGGGVCQVSSTLYNAVLLAGLTPTERSPHYYPSSYIAPGRDATVADDLLDFKFRNDLQHPVYLMAYATGSTLEVAILGTKADLNGTTVALEHAGSRLAPSLYRVYYKDGQVVKEEYLHTDSYHVNERTRD